MDYETVFEISQKPFEWWFASAGLLAWVAGAIFLTLGRRYLWPRWWMGYFFLGVGCLWFFAVTCPMYFQFRQLHNAYRNGTYQVVAGHVEDFRPMPYQGHQDECFRVQQSTFCYSDYGITPGFNNSASHGGPIRKGLPVKIAYSGDTILRLEVAKGFAPTASERQAVASEAENRMRELVKTDPQISKLDLGFALAMVFMALWWNLQWQRFVRFWIKPPNRSAVQKGFRIFFALSFAGAVSNLIYEFRTVQLSSENLLWAVLYGFIGIGIVILMVNTVEWMNRLRA